MRILNHEIPSAVGRTVTVAGWVHRRRRLAAVSFLILRDRSGLSQIVVKAPETQAQLDELGEETVVQVTGTVAANPQAPGGAEIVDPVIEPLTEPAATPPIELWRPTVGAGLPVVLDNAPVALRHPVVRAGWEIASAALHGFREALKIAGANPDEPDLAPADERAIGEWARREHGSEFVAVEGYPMVKRPFYTHPQPSDPRWSNSFDLLFKGVELVTGGQRLHRYSDYVAALEAKGESAESPAYRSYLQAFKHGMPPHGGFAIGLERFVARLTGVENVREVTLFPRDLHRLTP